MNKILVIGGTGYIGKVLVDKLIKENYDVTSYGSKECNVIDRKMLLEKVKGFDMIIYLVAVIRTTHKDKYAENFIGVWNTLNAMKKNNIKKICYFSTQAIYKKNIGIYAESKKICENLIKISNVDYVIVRPNYVYGIDKQNDIWRLYNIAKRFKLCPIIGNGNNKIQPIRKELLCDETIKFIKEWVSKNEIDISGDMVVSLNQIGEIISKRTKSKIIHIPISILKLFRRFIPFDINGYEEDMISDKNKIEGNNIVNDIEKISEL